MVLIVNYGPLNFNSSMYVVARKLKEQKALQRRKEKEKEAANVDSMELILNATNSKELQHQISEAIQYDDFKNDVLAKLDDIQRERYQKRLERGNFISKNKSEITKQIKNDDWVEQ